MKTRVGGALLTHAEYSSQRDELREREAELDGARDDWMRFRLFSNDHDLEACVRIGHRCTISIDFFPPGHRCRQIENWNELTAAQLRAVADLRAALEAWEDGRGPFPDPATWNRP